MKRAVVGVYVALLLWCTAMILWRRVGLGLVPTQASTAIVYATIVLNLAVAGILIRRWFFRFRETTCNWARRS